jgi:hypothetical protein
MNITQKRFKHHNVRNSILGPIYYKDGKNSTFIEFPIQILIFHLILLFIIQIFISELIGITNYYNRITFGHYTAYYLINGKLHELKE